MPKLTALGHIGLAFETAYGTPSAPVVWIPYTSVKTEDDIKKVVDDGKRAVLSKDFAVYNATQSGKVDIDFLAYPETLGYFLKAILGQDTVTGVAAPYTHTFKVVNTLGTSMTLQNFDGNDERQYAGSVIEEIQLKFDAETAITVTTKFMTQLGKVVTQTEPTFNVSNPFMGYTLAAKLNGVANANVVGGEITIKRETKLLFMAANTKDPSKFSHARIEIDGKLTFDIEDATEYTLFTAGTQVPIDLNFTLDANHSLDVSFGNVDISKATKDETQEFVRVDLSFKSLFNATDAGNTTIVLKNSVATY
jgi:hypothetical protein